MTNDQSVDPASVSWEHNETKRASDQTVFRAMAYDLQEKTRRFSERTAVKVLSFPGATFLWEQALAETFYRYKFKFTGLERDKTVHLKASSTPTPSRK